ncbi:MAG: DNA mismatch repair protein MutT [Betaproteobacteria bacterium RIFCSPLOWO2_02_FULL_66_14]|nr:MAG: DNA mismatch repair protein MutT [Betaproteobacteria bacterium RIFCSPLOWO2_02_FULL_66_14]
MVEVAAAVIERADGAFLLAQRPAGKVYAGWWEFPGGKVHGGETAAQALSRELHEELGVEVTRAYPWITRVHAYEHATVRLNFFRVVAWRGEPHPRENQAFVWQRFDSPMAEPMLPANAPVLVSLALPLEYAITDAKTLGVESSLARIEARLERGLRLIQVRDKGLPERERFIQSVAARAHAHGARVLVNGGPALADGIHYTAAQLATLHERAPEMLAGASCHTRAELDCAMRLGMDFAVLGPVGATASHPDAPSLGWEGFADIALGASIPVFAIGGLRPKDLHRARTAGAHGLAMIRGAWQVPQAD